MNTSELEDFCRRWLAAWTGNKPQELLAFYAENARYRDPAQPAGLMGREQLGKYFSRLLAANPDWVWRVVEVLPTRAGCVLKWQATIPIAGRSIEEQGLDIVDIADGQITRNEVYFDRSAWLSALK